jgi:hypothetical protein
MTSETDLLKDIQDSLDTKPAEPAEVAPFKKAASSTDFADAMLKLPEVLTALKALTDEQHRQNDYVAIITGLDASIQQFSVQSKMNLDAIKQVEKQVEARLKFLDSSEAKHARLIERVNNILDSLEKVLKQF